ncbi:MAG: hypothetical protein V2G48_05915 [bacterium JZ-2024 1]
MKGEAEFRRLPVLVRVMLSRICPGKAIYVPKTSFFPRNYLLIADYLIFRFIRGCSHAEAIGWLADQYALSYDRVEFLIKKHRSLLSQHLQNLSE